MAHSQRGWSGARTPSAIKRVRQAQRRRAINQPRRTAAKTLVTKAVAGAADVVNNGGAAEDVREAVQRAVSALDRAAKAGVIHKNAADRRKSRLMLKINSALGGEGLVGAAKVARQTSKAAAAKEAKARIAASRATKAKGAQTAAGKARAALARTTRDSGTAPAPAGPAPETTTAPTTAKKTTTRATAKSPATKSTATKSTATKSTATKSTSTKSTTGKSTSKKS